MRLDGEFGTLTGVAAELGLDPAVIPQVSRRLAAAGPRQSCSVVRWGSAEPELVFLHGGGQNARTWDLVALDLGRPAIAVDLPGHGHSTWRADHDDGPATNAAAVAPVIDAHAPRAAAVVGMSLGGLTTIALAADRPDLVRRAVLVDVTPGSGQAARRMSREQRGATALLDGLRTFGSLDEMAGLAIAASPRRPAAAVRRGCGTTPASSPTAGGPGATTGTGVPRATTSRPKTCGARCSVRPGDYDARPSFVR